MTEEKQEQEQEATEASGKPFEWWREYDGQPVLIQLRDGVVYLGVTAPNNPVLNQERQPVHTPILKGTLHPKGSGEDFRLVVLTGDANPNNPHVKMEVVLHPDDAAFVTVVHAGIVQT